MIRKPEPSLLLRASVFALYLALGVVFLVFEKSFLPKDALPVIFWASGLGITLKFVEWITTLLTKRGARTTDASRESKSFYYSSLLLHIVDFVLLFFIHYQTEFSSTLYFFANLILIFSFSYRYGLQKSLFMTGVNILLFSTQLLLGSEIRNTSYLFIIFLYDFSFILICYLGGYFFNQSRFFESQIRSDRLTLGLLQKIHSAILDELPVGVIQTQSSTQQIITTNQMSRQIFETQDMEGRNLDDVLPKNVAQATRQLVDNKPSEIEIQTAGESRYLSLERFNLRLEKNETSVLMIQDKTPMRKLESELRQKEKLAAVGQLAAGIAHEIRNPLASISGSVELLSQTTASADDQKLMKIILKEISRLNNLITEFLEYAKPFKRPTEVIDLSVVVKEIMSLMVNQYVKIQTTLDLQEGILVCADRDKLKQALINIIVNGYQAVESKEGAHMQISLKTPTAGRASSAEAVLSIKDNGVGIKPENLSKIFEPFHTTKPKGTGLGLAVTHKILEAHEARIEVSSEPGQGTEFQLSFVQKNEMIER